MPIPGIVQPEQIAIGEGLRLRKYDGNFDFALAWYQDAGTVWLVDGNRVPYTEARLRAMYEYLDACSEAYFIEAREAGRFRPIGDAAFRRGDMPIVIGEPAYRGRGVGRRVAAALVGRGRALGYETLRVREIYDWNAASRKCFEAAGFRADQKTEHGSSFLLKLSPDTV